jgi:mannose-6-phosphate isomerase-like protein (cupin superfamily)
MIKKILKPKVIKAAGNKPELIEEYFGRINTQSNEISIAMLTCPQGWVEPAQKPEFTEYSIVFEGILKVTAKDKEIEVKAGEAIIVEKGEWVQNSTPYEGGAKYIAICIPAFSPELVHRE